MLESGSYGSVGAVGEKSPTSTRLVCFHLSAFCRQSRSSLGIDTFFRTYFFDLFKDPSRFISQTGIFTHKAECFPEHERKVAYEDMFLP